MRETAARQQPACLCWGWTSWQAQILQSSSRSSEDEQAHVRMSKLLSCCGIGIGRCIACSRSHQGQVGCWAPVPAGEAACHAPSAASLQQQALHGGVCLHAWGQCNASIPCMKCQIGQQRLHSMPEMPSGIACHAFMFSKARQAYRDELRSNRPAAATALSVCKASSGVMSKHSAQGQAQKGFLPQQNSKPFSLQPVSSWPAMLTLCRLLTIS